MVKADNVLPLVSVIVPCYNQGDFLYEALSSVLCQTYTNWECIIMNDGSTDNSEDVALEFCQKDSRFVYYYQDNQGVIASRNNAIRKSNGRYILPLDGDDKIAPTYLEKAVPIISDNPAVSIVYCLVEQFGEKEGLYLLPDFDINRMLYDNCIVVTALFRRSDYNKTKGYNPNMKKGLEDWDFWLSILELGGTAYRIDEVLFYYRIQNVSRNRSLNSVSNELKLRIIKNHPKMFFLRGIYAYRLYKKGRGKGILDILFFFSKYVRIKARSFFSCQKVLFLFFIP